MQLRWDDDEQHCPSLLSRSRSNAWVMWLRFCSHVFDSDQTLEYFQSVYENISYSFLNNAKRAKRKRKEMYKLGCAAGFLLPCLRYRLHNLVPVVWHRQMNWIPVCLGLQAKLKELSRQSCSVLWDTFYLDYVPMCVSCFKSSGSVTLHPCFKPRFLCIIYFVISVYGVKIVWP